MRHLQTIAITAFFVVMMGLLGRDHIAPYFEAYKPLSVDAAQLADVWSDRDEYQRIEFMRREVGAVRLYAKRLEGEPARYQVATHVLLNVLGSRFFLRSTSIANRRMELEQLVVQVHGPMTGDVQSAEELGSPRASLEAVVLGGDLFAHLKTDTLERRIRIPLQQPLVLADSLDTVLDQAVADPSRTYVVEMADPLFGTAPRRVTLNLEKTERIDMGKNTPSSVQVDANGEIETKRFRARADNAHVLFWTDANGRLVRRRFEVYRPGVTGELDAGDLILPTITLTLVDPRLALERYPLLRAAVEPLQLDAASLRQGAESASAESLLGEFGLLRQFSTMYQTGSKGS